jgi:aspartate kinase
MALTQGFVVMKFGGTSVADAAAIRRLADIVAAERTHTTRAPVVVVSAMAGVTDTLLALAGAAVAGDWALVQRGIEELGARHSEAASELLGPSRCATAVEALAVQIEDLRAVLTAVSILREASPRSLDGIASSGEMLSSHIVAAALAEAEIEGVWVDARRAIVTDAAHTCAAPQMAPTREAIAREIMPVLRTGRVPVVGGYVGATAQGITTTLGRGGSDYSAAIIAAAMRDILQLPESGAQSSGRDDTTHSSSSVEIQIWTDVDGMLTADPRIVDSPRVVTQLSFGEASELAYFGAKVLHPSTILPAVERDIPVRILNSRRPDSTGTLITSAGATTPRPIAAIACKQNITVIEVTSTRMLMAHGFLRRLFEVFERCGTPVDVVTTSEVSVSVTVDDDRRLDEIVTGLREFAEVLVARDMAILCVVGDHLRSDPTLAVRLLGSLEGFPLRMVSQAAARRNLTVVLHERDVRDAMIRLHGLWFAEPAGRLAEAGAGT